MNYTHLPKLEKVRVYVCSCRQVCIRPPGVPLGQCPHCLKSLLEQGYSTEDHFTFVQRLLYEEKRTPLFS